MHMLSVSLRLDVRMYVCTASLPGSFHIPSWKGLTLRFRQLNTLVNIVRVSGKLLLVAFSSAGLDWNVGHSTKVRRFFSCFLDVVHVRTRKEKIGYALGAVFALTASAGMGSYCSRDPF